MISLKYNSFILSPAPEGVVASTAWDGGELAVRLQEDPTGTVLFEGWWGEELGPRKTMIGGVCLYDGRWLLEFEGHREGEPAPRHSPMSNGDKLKISEKLRKGRRVAKIHYPLTPCSYHLKTIAWQAKTIRENDPQRILYHVPKSEYLLYIAELEELLGQSLEFLKEELMVFAKQIKKLLLGQLPYRFHSRVEFLDPMETLRRNGHPNPTPLDCYLSPYAHPQYYGTTWGDIYGVEELRELKLAGAVCQRHGVRIPVKVAAIENPLSYYDKNAKPGEFNTVYLN